MGFANAEQLRDMFLCGGMGFLLGAYYDVFRLLRLWLPSSVAVVFVQDGVYCISSAVAVFLFSLAVTDGELRVYLLVGLVIGFFAYCRTIGRVTARFFHRVRRLTVNFFVLLRKKRRFLFLGLKNRIKNRKKIKKALETERESIV